MNILTLIVRNPVRFLRLLATRFVEDGGLPTAASLSYTTLLSLVPLMTVLLAVFSVFPASEEVVEQIQDFVFQNFVPASGEVVRQYLTQFSAKASKLTGIGFAVLIVVALMLMVTIERAINNIWRARRKRSLHSKFMVYWAILTLGPLLIGLSMAATSILISNPIFSDTAESLGLRHRLLSAMPLLATVTAFSLVYLVVPNRRVPILHGIAGGVLAAVLFEITKRGFALYVTSFPTYQAIYGAMAVIPLFLIWIYLSWVVTLLGAEFAFCLGIFRDEARYGVAGEGGDFLLSYHLLQALWKQQQSGESSSVTELAERLGFVEEERLELTLELLREARLAHCVETGGWVLARDLSRTSLRDLYRSRQYVLPDPDLLERSADPGDQALRRVLTQLEREMDPHMKVSLDTLFRGKREPSVSVDNIVSTVPEEGHG